MSRSGGCYAALAAYAEKLLAAPRAGSTVQGSSRTVRSDPAGCSGAASQGCKQSRQTVDVDGEVKDHLGGRQIRVSNQAMLISFGQDVGETVCNPLTERTMRQSGR